MTTTPSAPFRLQRYAGNPILSPLPGSPWESEVATNPGAWLDDQSGDVLLLYRAAGHDREHTVRFGLARSRDGYQFERTSPEPVLSPIPHTIDGGCVEDPRIIRIGDWYHVTVATRPYPPGRYWENGEPARPSFPDHFPVALRKNLTSTQLFLTQDFKNWIRAGRISNAELDDRDVVIFPEKVGGKWITIHRPMQWHGAGYPNPFPAIWIAKSDDVLGWKHMTLLAQGEQPWEQKIGANNPPLKTEHGWLQIYHGVGADKQYRLGALLLDLADPTRVTHRTRDFIYEPEADYETSGIYNGVCFPCGHVVKDGTYFLYYGGADVHCCVATTPLQALLDHLLAQPV
jgi:beta-1,2-mannobiose phosphorylase / 1,2-beta-oligomannan phosphorylase